MVTTLEHVRSHARAIERSAQVNRIERVRVFGSVARGDDTEGSDVDLLIDPARDASLFDFAQFQIEVERVLGRRVDVVSARALDPERDRSILRDAVPL